MGRKSKIDTIEKIVEIHGLMLLNLYNVSEEDVDKREGLLKTYVELLSQEIEEYIIKKL